jgi:hypothetical protein
MPSRYQVDLSKRRVLSTATGVLTFKDATDHNRRLERDPLFDAMFSQLYDFRAVTRVALTADDIFELSRVRLFSPGSKRAFVTVGPVNTALARMYGSYRSPLDERGIRVFSEIQEAVAWLDEDESIDQDGHTHAFDGRPAGTLPGHDEIHPTSKRHAR